MASLHEGLNKAKLITAKLNDKSDQDDALLKRLSYDAGQLRTEVSDKTGHICELNNQLQEKDTLYAQLQHRMNVELKGLKDAMADYHKEYEVQSQNHKVQLTEAH